MAVAWSDLARALARGPARVEDVTQRAAVALVLREGPRGIELLFIRRAEHPEDPWSGQMAFPGGRFEPRDGDLLSTAVRETREEVGLDLEAGAERLGALDELRAVGRLRPMSLAISPFVFRLRGGHATRLSDEVTSAHWLPVDELLSARWRSQTTYEHQGTRLEFPCLRYEGLVIWGLTYRMFTGLQERLAGEDAVAGEHA